MKQRQVVLFETFRRSGCWRGSIAVVKNAEKTLTVGFTTKADGLRTLERLVEKKVISRGKAREVRRTIKRSPLPGIHDDGLRQEMRALEVEVEALRELAQSTAYLAEFLASDLGYERAEDESEQPPELLN